MPSATAPMRSGNWSRRSSDPALLRKHRQRPAIGSESMTTIDPALVHAWLAARSLSRGLPVPVADSGGWRVDTNGEAELRRYVFAEAGAGLTRIARSIHEPRIFIKLCSDAQTLRALPPPGWAIVDANRMMTSDAAPPTAPSRAHPTVGARRKCPICW